MTEKKEIEKLALNYFLNGVYISKDAQIHFKMSEHSSSLIGGENLTQRFVDAMEEIAMTGVLSNSYWAKSNSWDLDDVFNGHYRGMDERLKKTQEILKKHNAFNAWTDSGYEEGYVEPFLRAFCSLPSELRHQIAQEIRNEAGKQQESVDLKRESELDKEQAKVDEKYSKERKEWSDEHDRCVESNMPLFFACCRTSPNFKFFGYNKKPTNELLAKKADYKEYASEWKAEWEQLKKDRPWRAQEMLRNYEKMEERWAYYPGFATVFSYPEQEKPFRQVVSYGHEVKKFDLNFLVEKVSEYYVRKNCSKKEIITELKECLKDRYGKSEAKPAILNKVLNSEVKLQEMLGSKQKDKKTQKTKKGGVRKTLDVVRKAEILDGKTASLRSKREAFVKTTKKMDGSVKDVVRAMRNEEDKARAKVYKEILIQKYGKGK